MPRVDSNTTPQQKCGGTNNEHEQAATHRMSDADDDGAHVREHSARKYPTLSRMSSADRNKKKKQQAETSKHGTNQQTLINSKPVGQVDVPRWLACLAVWLDLPCLLACWQGQFGELSLGWPAWLPGRLAWSGCLASPCFNWPA